MNRIAAAPALQAFANVILPMMALASAYSLPPM